ncbi:MAG: DsrE family protein [Gammaproteobacteria bacterium]|nr:MAG: DsrE family protein [Gammaproteobacteria bacterium]
MKLAIIIYSNDAETIWNAFRLANTAYAFDDESTVFLLGKGVESASVDSIKFDVREQMDMFRKAGGRMIGCGVCCDTREKEMPFIKDDLDCETGSMRTLLTLIKENDKILTF